MVYLSGLIALLVLILAVLLALGAIVLNAAWLIAALALAFLIDAVPVWTRRA